MKDRILRVKTRIDELASISEGGSGITRRYGTAAAMEAGKKVLGWMQEAGMTARVDAIGNVRGVLRADAARVGDVAAAGGKTLVIASHIDTVVNAGRWDGPMGVVMGLDLVENIIKNGVRLPFDIELVAFCDEEGVRFHTTYLGSKVVAGSIEPEMLERRDEDGVSLLQAMGGDAGVLAEEAVLRLKGEAIAPERWLGYFEIHIEQGPVLYERNIPVAPVRAIAGQVRVEVIFKGMAGHAGTVPMEMRQDALCGAAEFVLAAEEMAGAECGLVATVGKLQVKGAASNVIPGEVVCSLDMRSADEAVLSRGHERLRALCLEIGLRRGLTIDWNVVQVSSPVSCDTRMRELLGTCIRAEGYEVLELVSGAGHDAVPVSVVSPVCMLFVRCFKGISHNPLEDVEEKDLEAA
ncbi:MAG TPA: M20 family metallo-hydrolase, partial [Puia sp.]|nr:M20 family metallo-hydrolase [Puia sp.]